MNSHDRIEDIEQRIESAYTEGNYEEAKSLETKLRHLRGTQNEYDEREPYSLEGRTFMDNE